MDLDWLLFTTLHLQNAVYFSSRALSSLKSTDSPTLIVTFTGLRTMVWEMECLLLWSPPLLTQAVHAWSCPIAFFPMGCCGTTSLTGQVSLFSGLTYGVRYEGNGKGTAQVEILKKRCLFQIQWAHSPQGFLDPFYVVLPLEGFIYFFP